MSKPLVVVVDEEAKAVEKAERNHYFAKAKHMDSGSYVLETPLGERREVYGSLLLTENEHKLREHTAEYLYLELTDACNFQCHHCGVKDGIKHIDDLTNEDVSYMTTEFATELRNTLSNYPNSFGMRNLFYGGGEPLIAPGKFSTINNILNQIEKTEIIVITNGTSLPLKGRDFKKFAKGIGDPYLFFTISNAHKKQYEVLARKIAENMNKHGQIPLDLPYREAINHKIGIVQKNCNATDTHV